MQCWTYFISKTDPWDEVYNTASQGTLVFTRCIYVDKLSPELSVWMEQKLCIIGTAWYQTTKMKDMAVKTPGQFRFIQETLKYTYMVRKYKTCPKSIEMHMYLKIYDLLLVLSLGSVNCVCASAGFFNGDLHDLDVNHILLLPL